MSTTVPTRAHTDQSRTAGERSSKTTAALADAMAIKRSINASLCHKADAVAEMIGISPQMLRSAASEDATTHLPLRRLLAFLRSTPDPMPLLTLLCHAAGAVPFRLPQGADAKPMAECVRQFGDVLDAHSEGIEDGVWEATEVERLRKETNELIAAALANLAHVEARVRRTA